MEPTPIACERHLTLVSAALADDATDADLERYADEVPDCTECRRALARDLQVHPVVLETDGQAEMPSIEGMDRLARALADRPSPWRAAARWSMAAAVLAAALWSGSQLMPTSTPDAPTPAAAIPVEPVERTAEVPEPPPPAERDGPQRQAPQAAPVVEKRRLAPKVAVPAPTVAVASVEPDWEPPAFVELRRGTLKGEGRLQGFQLVLTGGTGERAIGDTVRLQVVASASTPMAVCVGGPENGVVWRGGVPAGRVDLERDGHLQAFTFSTSGTYRFALSTSDLDSCEDPVHVLKVDVLP
ncbi:MAG: hypothetical protein KTR31_22900 [Myxococcales bacterium]|nr:hypothetical protein [Myxococcales bacterium]